MKFPIRKFEKGDGVTDSILNIENLKAGYKIKAGNIVAVDDVSLGLKPGEFLGIAGESGCGKSTLAYAIMDLLEDNGRVFDGKIMYRNQNICEMSDQAIRDIRWNHISMVFQSAMNSLNPVTKIKSQLTDAIFAHKKGIKKKQALSKAMELLDLVDIPFDRMDAYPHQLSGGMKQRVMIAMALVLDPDLIIMDEPTTALDVVVQRTIIEKIAHLREKLKFSVIFITHDLSLLVEISDTLAIMYAGEIIEYGRADDVYLRSQHPYTRGLMKSFPPLTADIEDFQGIPGRPPDFFKLPQGCRFSPRCTHKMPVCQENHPELEERFQGHKARCFLKE
jgi:peptide/nickel transport system ATP-binding protein